MRLSRQAHDREICRCHFEAHLALWWNRALPPPFFLLAVHNTPLWNRIGINQLFSFSSDKDRRTDSRIRRKKHSAAPPGIEPRILRVLVARSNHWATKPQRDPAVSSSIFLGAEREELIRNDHDKSEFTIELAFLLAMEQESALNPFAGGGGDFGEKRGPGKIIFPLAGSVGWHAASFYSISVPRAEFFPVFAMFAMTTMDHSVTLTRYPRLQALRLVEHIFHCLPIVWFFRQAHKHPTKPNDHFLQILTCWTWWQASFFINLKRKTSKPAQMKSSFTKIFEAKKNWQK